MPAWINFAPAATSAWPVTTADLTVTRPPPATMASPLRPSTRGRRIQMRRNRSASTKTCRFTERLCVEISVSLVAASILCARHQHAYLEVHRQFFGRETGAIAASLVGELALHT